MTYFANMDIDNSRRLPKPLQGENKDELCHQIQSMAYNERKKGEVSSFWVDDENGNMVYGGIFDDYGFSSLDDEINQGT